MATKATAMTPDELDDHWRAADWRLMRLADEVASLAVGAGEAGQSWAEVSGQVDFLLARLRHEASIIWSCRMAARSMPLTKEHSPGRKVASMDGDTRGAGHGHGRPTAG